MPDRSEALRRMLERDPDDLRARFGLAVEHERTGRWEEAARELARYLEAADDEGNAHGRLAGILLRLGREEEARVWYGRGIEASLRHGHPTMAQEYEDLLAEL